MTCELGGNKPSTACKTEGLKCSGSRDHATTSARQAHDAGNTYDGITKLSDPDAAAEQLADWNSRFRDPRST
jgi:hypothetical protein